MSNQTVLPPYPIFFDADGKALEDGYIYVGTENQSAITNPISIYWDEDLLYPASQPVRTIGGYPSRNGSPGRLYAASAHSILVQDKNQKLVYSANSSSMLFSSGDVTFAPSYTGAVSRTVLAKLSEFISVKDFGAVGDGSTDDTAAVQAAMTYIAANGGALYWPDGTYVLSSLVEVTLTYAIQLIGHSAIIQMSVADATGFKINTSADNLSMYGLTFDGNSTTGDCCVIYESTQSNNVLTIENCSFINSYQTSTGDNNGLYISGGIGSVRIHQCQFRNHTRALGAGTPSSSGTIGCAVTQELNLYYPEFVVVTDCTFDTITNSETTAGTNNVDCDGLSIFGVADGTNYRKTSAIVKGCYFKNCKGRGIKGQVDKAVITACEFYRDISPIGTSATNGSSEINLQFNGGQISDCTFQFDDTVAGESVFVRPVNIISFYNGSDNNRDRVYNISNIQIFSSATTSDILYDIISAGDNPDTLQDSKIINVDNVICDTPIDHFMIWPGTRAAYSGRTVVNIRDCMVKNLKNGVVETNSTNGIDNNQLNISNFTNLDSNGQGNRIIAYAGSSVPNPATLPYSLIYASIGVRANNTIGLLTEFDYSGNIVTTDASNLQQRGFPTWGVSAKNVEETVTPTDAIGDDTATETGLRIFTCILEDEDDIVLPVNAFSSVGLFFIHCNYDYTSNGLFCWDAAQGVTSLATTGTLFSLDSAGTPGTNPDTNLKINLWVSGGDRLGIKNRIGEAPGTFRRFTVTVLA